MTTEEKKKAATDIKQEILSRLRELDADILLTENQIIEHKKSVHQLKSELSKKMNLELV
jgi:hypothetical protein